MKKLESISYLKGWTMRDEFAAKAMQAHMQTYPENSKVNDGYIPITAFEAIALWSYEMADEMLKAREKKDL